MDQKSDVAGGESGDGLDFAIAEVLLEFEDDHFALIGAEPVEARGDLVHPILSLGFFIGWSLRPGQPLPLDFIERLLAFVLPQEVEGPVPADREQPGLEVVPDALDVLMAEPGESVLHHVAGEIGVVEECRSIADERGLIGVHGLLDELFPRGRMRWLDR